MDNIYACTFFQLESLSREDLLKFIKKQLVLLQKERVKNDGEQLTE